MRVIIQRVTEASVTIQQKLQSSIATGILIFVGIENNDNKEDIDWIKNKIIHLRIFNDKNDVMNLPITDVAGEILIISQFTLFANTKKGNRPSYIKAAKPNISLPIYESFVSSFMESGLVVKTGVFGQDMKVSLTNDGPVTIFIDSKNRE